MAEESPHPNHGSESDPPRLPPDGKNAVTVQNAWWPILLVLGAVILVYSPIFSAGFLGFDDDIHVYANPFLNPPTMQSVGRLWHEAYEHLYVPLSYTLFAVVARLASIPMHADSSIGRTVSLDPGVFHAVSVGFHLVNALLCLLLAWQLTRRRSVALLCSLVFALHPLQLESVGWISELRGLSSGCFALMALNAFVQSRRAARRTSRWSLALLVASAGCVACAMLCKPTAASLPLLALTLDRFVFKTPWRSTVVAMLSWSACVVPLAWITRTVQTVSAADQSVLWQRPFIAGDALAFYLFKVLWPSSLCVDYGRTPQVAMAGPWGYLAWVVPVGLLWISYRNRQRRPFTWVGALMFACSLLPTLGLVPFAYQAYSTVADRYSYLALIGIGLIAAETVDVAASRTMAMRVASAALVILGVRSFNQGQYWLENTAFLRQTIQVNPNAAFAYNNLGDVELANGEYGAARADYQACVERDPTRLKAFINLADAYSALKQPAEAEKAIAQAEGASGMAADDLSNLGIVLMKMNQPDRALRALSSAAEKEPNSSVYLYNQANALAATGQFGPAEVAYRRCIELAPTLAGAHIGLGIVLAETNRLNAAVDEFRSAVRLQPNDSAALDNLKRAEALLAQQQGQ